jgi:hypothetical protein
MNRFCLPENKAQFKQKITVFSCVYTTLPYLTAFDSLVLYVACRFFIKQQYLPLLPHQENRCQGKTPMETFLENDPLAREKILDMKEDKLALAA